MNTWVDLMQSGWECKGEKCPKKEPAMPNKDPAGNGQKKEPAGSGGQFNKENDKKYEYNYSSGASQVIPMMTMAALTSLVASNM